MYYVTTPAWQLALKFNNKSSAVAEMGDRLPQ